MGELRWFAAYVRSRHEKRVADRLTAREIERFLPLWKDERKWSDRKVELLLPLFPGYVFVRIERERRTDVLETPGVLYLVGASGHPEALEDEEMERLKELAKGVNPRPEEYANTARVGERVVVAHGPLQGTEGILVREKGRGRVVVSVASIERAMSVEVSMEDVAHISEIPRASGAVSAREGVLGVESGGVAASA